MAAQALSSLIFEYLCVHVFFEIGVVFEALCGRSEHVGGFSLLFFHFGHLRLILLAFFFSVFICSVCWVLVAVPLRVAFAPV